ncbi:hypothetical protein JAAARDRAFT_45286 [Jaapia argillacea MUCL 33604]|uniref:MULE transposase domain-containing protein n=1 Tax=Jaapia argillacea MUCL 33604 TaxID=933084 RepID=A0A067Q461_9AGAM|nr:hypothetical protein JAAARDRAFT_45286 [Jaapia argillacea MUCL 33604]
MYCCLAASFTRRVSTFMPSHATEVLVTHLQGCIKCWVFEEAPLGNTFHTIDVHQGELIPHKDDPLPIMQELEAAWKNGKRYAAVMWAPPGMMPELRQCPLPSFRLFMNINNKASSIEMARNVLAHVLRDSLLSPNDIEKFSQLRISLRIEGFRASKFPLYELACLLHETWLEEDVLNVASHPIFLFIQTLALNPTVPSQQHGTGDYLPSPPLMMLADESSRDVISNTAGPGDVSQVEGGTQSEVGGRVYLDHGMGCDTCPKGMAASPTQLDGWVDLTLSPTPSPRQNCVKKSSSSSPICPSTPTPQHAIISLALPAKIIIIESDSNIDEFELPDCISSPSLQPPRNANNHHTTEGNTDGDNRHPTVPTNHIRIGLLFDSLEEAQDAVYAQQESLGHVWHILVEQFPNRHRLKPKQVSNILTEARQSARDEVRSLGGDVPAILAELQKLNEEGEPWHHNIRLNEDQVIIGLWWQSPRQAELTRRFTDILVNDCSYNRNQYGFALNIGIIIDNFGHSRNGWYAVHASEDLQTHCWVFRNHLRTSNGVLPEGNAATHLRHLINDQWEPFLAEFWAAYRAVSLEEFDHLWTSLLEHYPVTWDYLQEELYPCREWTSNIFTAGIRTSGQAEVENRMNGIIGGPKKSFLELFKALNEQAEGQTLKEMESVRKVSSCQQHNSHLDAVFKVVLDQLREHVGSFALHTCYSEMLQSFYYSTNVLQMPDGVRSWTEFGVQVSEEVGFHWLRGKGNSLMNTFANDQVYITTRWLICLIIARGLQIQHLLQVKHKGTQATHLLALLPDALTWVKNLSFHIGLIRARWYQNPALDITNIPPITFDHISSQLRLDLHPCEVLSSLQSNPLQRAPLSAPAPPWPTQTLLAHEVYYEAMAALCPLLNGVQTTEQLKNLTRQLDELHHQQLLDSDPSIRDPPVLKRKGHPHTNCITGSAEGPPRGGGARTTHQAEPTQLYHGDSDLAARGEDPHRDDDPEADGNPSQAKHQRIQTCSICKQPSHNRLRCPCQC